MEPPIYNSVSSCQNPITWGNFMKMNEAYSSYEPGTSVMWYYMFMLNRHLWVHNICAFFLHIVPAVIVDTLARITGREPVYVFLFNFLCL